MDDVRPGEVFFLRNLSPRGDIRFELPNVTPPIYCRWDGGRQELFPMLDTVLIEPDLDRFALSFRATVGCGRKPNRLREIVIGQLSSARRRAFLTGKKLLTRNSLSVVRQEEE